uniref:RRM domain-containing protein n=1 Tax=Trichuris muris TaxID=70415 RepID=A0A5S6QRM3_TRIMR
MRIGGISFAIRVWLKSERPSLTAGRLAFVFILLGPPQVISWLNMQNCKLFIGNLSPVTTTDGLLKFYTQFGTVVDCKVLRHIVTKQSRGFGFVTFSSAEMVNTAMRSRPHRIDGKTVHPKRALPKEVLESPAGPIATTKIFVRGVTYNHDTEVLERYFSQFGDVTEVIIMVDSGSGKRRGFANVTFDDYDAVDQVAIQKFHAIAGTNCAVYKFENKDEQRKRLQKDNKCTPLQSILSSRTSVNILTAVYAGEHYAQSFGTYAYYIDVHCYTLTAISRVCCEGFPYFDDKSKRYFLQCPVVWLVQAN